MNRLENEYINKKRINEEALIPFGFVKNNNEYVYTEPVADGKLPAEQFQISFPANL